MRSVISVAPNFKVSSLFRDDSDNYKQCREQCESKCRQMRNMKSYISPYFYLEYLNNPEQVQFRNITDRVVSDEALIIRSMFIFAL